MIKLKIKPLADRVLVEPLEAETKTASGIIIPDSAQEKPMQGEIIAVGNGARDDTGKVVALESANKRYETKIFGPDRVKVQGVLISLYRNFQ